MQNSPVYAGLFFYGQYNICINSLLHHRLCINTSVIDETVFSSEISPIYLPAKTEEQ